MWYCVHWWNVPYCGTVFTGGMRLNVVVFTGGIHFNVVLCSLVECNLIWYRVDWWNAP